MILAREALELDVNSMRRAAAHEAMQRLGLLKPEAEDIIVHLLDDRFVDQHPRALCTAYRKDGEQLSKAELKALGLRSNAFLSTKALDELTEQGRANPLTSHEKVLLRAVFTMSRYRSILQTRGLRIPKFKDQYKYDMLTMDCPACAALEGSVTKGDAAYIFPPDNCICETANYALNAHIDWLDV